MREITPGAAGTLLPAAAETSNFLNGRLTAFVTLRQIVQK